MDNDLVHPDLAPDAQTNADSDLMMTKSPVWLFGLSSVLEAEHDGEGAGRQQLLVLIVVEAVGCCQGKSTANLKKSPNILDSLKV